jgi:multidrug efflux system membrane fusion protein
VTLAGALLWYTAHGSVASPTRGASSPPAIPVIAAAAERHDVPIDLTGLGTVRAFNTVTIKARVDGQLDKVAFTEGQDVKAGDLLAQIDPRPFRAQLEQAQAQEARDQAQLGNARLDLQRFLNLATRQFATTQSVDTQKATVAQLEAAVQADQAQIDFAQVQLGYTTITAPIAGRTGLRLVDQGNIVHASDSTGLVVITQIEPISVVFTLPEDDFADINRAMGAGVLPVQALSRDGKVLADGTLLLINNQIDQATGTIELKATFPNHDHALWPGQFVNARLRLAVRRDGVTVPPAAIQRGPQGTFVYVIRPDGTAELRPVAVAVGDGARAVGDDARVLIDRGIAAGERVVIDGQYKLRPGARADARPPDGKVPAAMPAQRAAR